MKAKVNYNLKQNNENALNLTYKGIFNVLGNNEFKLSYNDNGVMNTLSINADSSVITVSNKNIMYFEKGVTNNIEYRTDFGIITLKLICHNVEVINENKKMILRLAYDLMQGNDKLENELEIEILY